MPTPYQELNKVLKELVSSIQPILGRDFIGAYLQGSFAVGDFDLHSDVDFIVVINEALSEAHVHALNQLHSRIYDLDIEWAKHLEGSYFPKDILRHYSQAGTPIWYLDHGSRTLIQSAHCNMVLVRWVLRENGVTLAGPPSASLIDPIPVARLREEILATIFEEGGRILQSPGQYNNRFYQALIVLNFCRMLHDLQRGFPGSKAAGAQWAKTYLAPDWNGLIDRAWYGRPNPAVSVRQRADPADFSATLEFVRYIINESAHWADSNPIEG